MMIKRTKFGAYLVLMLIMALILPGYTNVNKSNTEKQMVEKAVHNFLKSVVEKDSSLYQNSVIQSSKMNPDIFTSESQILDEFRIQDSKKVNDSLYEVTVIKTVDGILYPPIPYDVRLENGKWKFDNTTITIYPKALVRDLFQNIKDQGFAVTPQAEAKFYKNVVSENEDFYIMKQPVSSVDSGLNGLTSFLTYSFNEHSTDIYINGSMRVYSTPGTNNYPDDEYNFTVAEWYDEDPVDKSFMGSEILDGFDPDHHFFTCYGYNSTNVYNMNYGISGSYDVFWD